MTSVTAGHRVSTDRALTQRPSLTAAGATQQPFASSTRCWGNSICLRVPPVVACCSGSLGRLVSISLMFS